jgi:hypothetical protein
MGDMGDMGRQQARGTARVVVGRISTVRRSYFRPAPAPPKRLPGAAWQRGVDRSINPMRGQRSGTVLRTHVMLDDQRTIELVNLVAMFRPNDLASGLPRTLRHPPN